MPVGMPLLLIKSWLGKISVAAVVEAKGLTKRFGELVAVSSIDFEIEEGEVFGLLGPNGAGKTTTISMLATLLRPTGGTARVAGFDVVQQPAMVRRQIGIVFQEPSTDDLLTGWENLEMHGLLYGMPREQRRKAIDEALELVGLTGRKDDLVRQYSGGMRRRLELARGLMHRPKVLFLDEPTLGLDPQTREHIWEYIRRLAKEERITVLLTTHYMEEADLLCDRVAIIDFGKIVVADEPERLKHRIGGDLVRIKQKRPEPERFRKLPYVKNVGEKDGELVIAAENVTKNLQDLLARAGEIESVEVKEATLNDVFLHYTGREFHEEAGEGGWMERAMMAERRGR